MGGSILDITKSTNKLENKNVLLLDLKNYSNMININLIDEANNKRVTLDLLSSFVELQRGKFHIEITPIVENIEVFMSINQGKIISDSFEIKFNEQNSSVSFDFDLYMFSFKDIHNKEIKFIKDKLIFENAKYHRFK